LKNFGKCDKLIIDKKGCDIMFRSLFDPGYKEYKRNAKQADKVMALEDEYRKLTDEQLREKTVILSKD